MTNTLVWYIGVGLIILSVCAILAVAVYFFIIPEGVFPKQAEQLIAEADFTVVSGQRHNLNDYAAKPLPLSPTTTSGYISSFDRRLSAEEIKIMLKELILTSQKVIELDLSNQKLILWEYGEWKGESAITTGKPSTPTRSGVFRVLDKYDMAYGGIPGQRWAMPYWLGIYYAGSTENGIHELPFINGYRESASSLGHPVSHGCVRLPLGVAKSVYDWAEVGTPVVIHY